MKHQKPSSVGTRREPKDIGKYRIRTHILGHLPLVDIDVCMNRELASAWIFQLNKWFLYCS